MNDKPERSDYNPDALPERTIHEVELFEFGPVTFPAYAGATAGVRSVWTPARRRRRLLEVLARVSAVDAEPSTGLFLGDVGSSPGFGRTKAARPGAYSFPRGVPPPVPSLAHED